MANTYTQIHIHFVIAVKNRQALIREDIRVSVEKYITGIVQHFGHKLMAIYCMPDHAHIFVGFRTNQSLSDFMREVKSRSSSYINKEILLGSKFNWQEGYGAFSYSRSHIKNVVRYILNQPEHHRKKTFKNEYLEILEKFELQYDAQYLFDWTVLDATSQGVAQTELETNQDAAPTEPGNLG